METIKHTGDDKKGSFFIENHNRKIAEMTYVFAGPTKIIIDHTQVDEAYGGRGLGRELLNAVIAFAREKGYKILPLCPYAKSVFSKTAEYNDVLSD